MPTKTIFALLWVHWFADFVLQTDDMATKKSTSNAWLLAHICAYTSLFFFWGWKFAIINGASHFIVDYCTSRVNSRLYKAGKIHWFFVGIGFDQAVHVSILLYTAGLLL